MRAAIADNILCIHAADLPRYQKQGSVVRNTYFWALRSISCYAPRAGEWEYDAIVWVALERLLTSFTTAGYLGLSETNLQFPYDTVIPPELRPVATWYDPADFAETDAGEE
ncbi:hypothetical protein PN441_20335 [Spirulina major CS-329]|jgi:hypothetical protein|uniref:hypothetical protein n=1 Tax=Spirulina TaxID=1154 RepID=UPI0023314C13|nr:MULTISPECIES: hypothetical protein [Spirulina]MDB9493718.1 hypothetical protein [Spirulina subsalsa CS-330]MDB9505433.1 hypothetical protein [Spirulina major CS-329]